MNVNVYLEADYLALQARCEQAEAKLVGVVVERDAWKRSQEATEKMYQLLVDQLPGELINMDPIAVEALAAANEQARVGTKQIADLQAKLAHLERVVEGLPKVEGKIWVCREEADDFWLSVCYGTEGEYEVFARQLDKESADAIAALLEYRQKEKP